MTGKDKIPTPAEFYDMLADHDWYHAMSDDHSVWSRGIRELNRLSGMASSDPVLQDLFTKYSAYMFTGPTWGTAQTPKPEKPT